MTRCPHPEKIAFPSKRIAKSAMYRVWRHRGPRKLPRRVYHCQCGAWHMTSKPLEK